MRIIKLSGENFMRLNAVAIEPSGNVIEINGRNGQGKTSVLRAIECALGGKRFEPDNPVHNGQTSAKIQVEIGGETVEFIVERTFKAGAGGGRSELKLTTAKGAPVPRAQESLNGLVGMLSFDPLGFSRMKAAEQVDTLKAVTGLDFSALDEQEAALRDERTQVGREKKSLAGQLDGMPIVNAPDQETSASEIAARHEAAIEQRNANAKARDEFVDMQASLSDIEGDIEEKKQAIERLKAELASLERDRIAQIARIDEESKRLETLEDPDIDAIKKEMDDVESLNASVRAKQKRTAVAADLNAKTAAYDALTEQIAAIGTKREQMIADSQMPVEGLAFDSDGVTYNGMPFGQCSSAEQLRVSVAMGFALNPKLRIMLVRDGSLLDEDSLKLLGQMAEQYDGQVWLEVVSKGERGIIIEDGAVVADLQEATAC